MYEVLKYIHDNAAAKPRLPDTAARFGYSKWYFCEKFREYTGKSYTEYLRALQMQMAAREILDGAKCSDVALRFGYDTPGGFNKAFLREFGCLPRQYRKMTVASLRDYERRRDSMYQLSDRCALLREDAVNTRRLQPLYSLQRSVYFTVGYHEALMNGGDAETAMGRGIARTLESFMPVIAPGELIVGFNFADNPPSSLKNDHHSGEYASAKDDEEGRAALRRNGISEADQALYFAAKDAPGLPWPEIELTQAEKDSETEWSAIGRCIDGNHTVLGYDKVLKKGFAGLLADVEAMEAKNGPCPLYTAAKDICRAACQMGKKYAAKARELLDARDPAYNEADLKKIIENCSVVPERPAETFSQAVQAMWFAHIVNTWEDTVNANSVGHLDWMFLPYYKADLERGALTKDEAFELICCLWIKLYRDYDVQQCCVGGTDSEGRSRVSDLSYMMLDATERLDFIRCMSVRFSKATEKPFLERALEVVGHVQKGVPFFFNDDVMIPALASHGVAYEDACDYTNIGCVETVIPGKSNPHAVTGETNLLKALEYALCDGRSMMYPEMDYGLRTGGLDDFPTYDSFYQAVLKQINLILDLSCGKILKHRSRSVVTAPKPYKSLLTEGCIETGRDFNDAGALYDYYQVMLGGIPNLADSLAVIRKFVYEDKKYTLAQLKAILEADFPDESVRQEFINKAPKFGNDIDEVDDIAVDIANKACDMLEALSEKYRLLFHAQPFTYLWMVDHGRAGAASPDGRRKGEIIAYSVSPMQGRDFNGLTALLNSISKFPTRRTPGTTSAIVEIDPKLFTDRNIGALADMLRAAGLRGLQNVQFNTVDADTLIDAKAHPEKYNNLAVRVSGFSQKFNLLSPELQDHIIGRTKHTCF